MVYTNMIPTKTVPAGSSAGPGSGLPGAQVGAGGGAQTGGPEAALKAERYRPRICESERDFRGSCTSPKYILFRRGSWVPGARNCPLAKMAGNPPR